MFTLPVIPTWLRYFVIAAAVVWLQWQVIDYVQTTERKACELAATKVTLTQTTVDLGASENLRGKERATDTKRAEASDDHIDRIKTMERDLGLALSAAERLRQQLADTKRVAQRGCGPEGDPEAEQSRQAVEALAAVFGACEAEQRAMAQAATEHLDTGLRCEAEYVANEVSAEQ